MGYKDGEESREEDTGGAAEITCFVQPRGN